VSVDFEAILFVGVPVGEVITTRTDTKEVQKFHPDTGEKYVKLEQTTVSLVCGREQADPYGYLEDGLKLDTLDPGYYHNPNATLVGVEVATADQEDPAAVVLLTSVAAARDAVDRTLRAHGYTGPAPTLYVVLKGS